MSLRQVLQSAAFTSRGLALSPCGRGPTSFLAGVRGQTSTDVCRDLTRGPEVRCPLPQGERAKYLEPNPLQQMQPIVRSQAAEGRRAESAADVFDRVRFVAQS